MNRPESNLNLAEIEPVDAVVAEDGRTIVIYFHTANPDQTPVATIDLPQGILPSHLGLDDRDWTDPDGKSSIENPMGWVQ